MHSSHYDIIPNDSEVLCVILFVQPVNSLITNWSTGSEVLQLINVERRHLEARARCVTECDFVIMQIDLK
jgi:hypothetical protein